VADAARRVAHIGAEGRLPVGTGRHEANGAPLPEHDRGVEPPSELEALVFERDRRHGDPYVVGEQRDELIDVADRGWLGHA
jgi:hypothetical protein